jgi:hypothetical protein
MNRYNASLRKNISFLAIQNTYLTVNKELIHFSLQIIRNKNLKLAKSSRSLVQFLISVLDIIEL